MTDSPITPERATRAQPVLLADVIGHEQDPEIGERLHHLRHQDRVEYLHLPAADLERRRLRATSDAGTDYAILLPRDQRLQDGAVLLLDEESAVVVRAGARRTLTFRATAVSSALRLGFLAGHLHWKSEFDGDRVQVWAEGPDSDYLDRLGDLLEDGRVCLVDPVGADLGRPA